MWQWLHDLSPGQATFLGWVVGFVTLVGGALLNSWLNRKRDDRLRREDQRAVATALRAELVTLSLSINSNSETLKKEGYLKPDEGFVAPDYSHSVRIMPEMVPKLGLLDQETIESVVDAYVVLEGFYERLILVGGRLEEHLTAPHGHRRLVAFPTGKAPSVVAMNSGLLDAIQKAIAKLDAFLARIK
jgi:hypothetical protein